MGVRGSDEDENNAPNSVKAAMDKSEEEINSYFHRLEVLERNLKYKSMSNDEREAAEKDVAQIKKILVQEDNRLQALRGGAGTSTMVAVVLFFACFLAFGLYKMINNAATSGLGTGTRLQF